MAAGSGPVVGANRQVAYRKTGSREFAGDRRRPLHAGLHPARASDATGNGNTAAPADPTPGRAPAS
jgi:hypothetical protein